MAFASSISCGLEPGLQLLEAALRFPEGRPLPGHDACKLGVVEAGQDLPLLHLSPLVNGQLYHPSRNLEPYVRFRHFHITGQKKNPFLRLLVEISPPQQEGRDCHEDQDDDAYLPLFHLTTSCSTVKIPMPFLSEARPISLS